MAHYNLVDVVGWLHCIGDENRRALTVYWRTLTEY